MAISSLLQSKACFTLNIINKLKKSSELYIIFHFELNKNKIMYGYLEKNWERLDISSAAASAATFS
ncbi:hypothetical protein HQ585_20605 [candidate division KSB1 bacterium]|nr:hypothetical protein [candidate division KSB1 bacterium]